MEFRISSKSKTNFVRFWEGADLVDHEMSSISGNIPVVKGELNLISQLQSVIVTDQQLKPCGGCNADVPKAWIKPRTAKRCPVAVLPKTN